MTDATKIMLSSKELELACNTDWILTKHQIIQKTVELLGGLSDWMKAYAAINTAHLPGAFTAKNAKISKGENYHRLPYVILDYPRQFGKDDTLAIRTMFWWGHFFSVSLQLSGTFKEHLLPRLKSCYLQLQQQDYQVCVHSDPWEHHFEPDNYIAIRSLTEEAFSTILNREPFVKIGKKIALPEWAKVSGFVMQSFEELAALYINYQDGGTGPLPGIPKVDSGL